MVPDVRSSGSSFAVNLLTTEGVAAALALVRESALSREEKRELRDLVFAYSVRGGDASLRTTLEERLRTLSLSAVSIPTVEASTPVSVVQAAPSGELAEEVVVELPSPAQTKTVTDVPVSTPNAGFPTGRVVPQFGVSATAEPVPAPVSIETPSFESQAQPQEFLIADPIVESQPLPADLQPTTPVVENVPLVAESTVVTEGQPVEVLEMSVTPEPPIQSTADEYRARITEIKNAINTKVGNPVNLVDMNNEVGRAYMTALLEAMKAVASDTGAAAAMERLEAVVRQVETVLANTEPAPLPMKPSVPPAAAPASSTRINPVVPVAPSVSEVSVAPVTATSVAPVILEMPARPSAEPISGFTSEGSLTVAPEDTIPVTPIAIASSRFKNIKPMSEVDPLKKPTDLPTAQELKARSGITDPLQDPDVDLGLEQLLGEWSIFRKSGVFGTGPKGRQHPLFVKLASVQIPLILAGRFEGVTPEIRQSITDYMNGWRYEQGITYEQDELFEHYLRRVIRHILDSQTRRRTA
jgi:hypothetical protein